MAAVVPVIEVPEPALTHEGLPEFIQVPVPPVPGAVSLVSQKMFAALAGLGVPTARRAAATISEAREKRGRGFELFIRIEFGEATGEWHQLGMNKSWGEHPIGTIEFVPFSPRMGENPAFRSGLVFICQK